MDGLLPAIVQSSDDGTVLMLGYMNEEALRTTIQTNLVTFYSRTRECQWTKGETSGNTLIVKGIRMDCDGDTLLVSVEPQGPVCHLGTKSCFSPTKTDTPEIQFIGELLKIIDTKFAGKDPSSYVFHLAQRGKERIAQKIGEEGVETAIASVAEDRENIIEESSDLLFHMLVNLRFHEIDFQEIITCLKGRHARRSEQSESK